MRDRYMLRIQQRIRSIVSEQEGVLLAIQPPFSQRKTEHIWFQIHRYLFIDLLLKCLRKVTTIYQDFALFLAFLNHLTLCNFAESEEFAVNWVEGRGGLDDLAILFLWLLKWMLMQGTMDIWAWISEISILTKVLTVFSIYPSSADAGSEFSSLRLWLVNWLFASFLFASILKIYKKV